MHNHANAADFVLVATNYSVFIKTVACGEWVNKYKQDTFNYTIQTEEATGMYMHTNGHTNTINNHTMSTLLSGSM